MCGIVGLISDRRDAAEMVERLTDSLAHRGPDSRGTWVDRELGIGLGHRRLAIVDLSPNGSQPMISSDGRWVITFNGEIYNHQDLRSELEAAHAGPQGGWRGHSDTETLVEAIAAWGVDATLSRATGMFAFGLWDRADRTLRLARDRFGEKPLYYGWVGGDFLFASELTTLTRHPGFDNEISREALAVFASRTYVPAPLSIYRRIFKLPPATVLEVAMGAPDAPADESPAIGTGAGPLRLRSYWSYGEVLAQGLRDPITDERSALEALEEALARSIRSQSIADVPVGVFLSGGIDSSNVAALYQRHSSVPVRSFTIGFEDSDFNEANHARTVAQHLGTIHEEKYVTVKDAIAVIPRLPQMFGEPFGDASAIPTFLVSAFARRQVKVVLSGDGGDELFAGYRRHLEALRLWATLRPIPRWARSAAAGAVGHVPFGIWTHLDSLLGRSRRSPLAGKVQKGLRVAAAARAFDELYAAYLDQWPLDGPPVTGAGGSRPGFPLDPGFDASNAVRMTYCDAVAYLPDDILCKVDRASMAVGLETRVPFLDHRVAEVAARVPMSMKLHGQTGKWILRRMLARQLPEALFDRPKCGFSLPLGDWLRGELRDWAEDLLDPSRMRQEGFFDARRVQEQWQANLAKRRNASSAIWSILMFQEWLRSAREGRLPVEVEQHAA